MKIKSLVITTILLTSTIWSQAQQINAVPDYVFRNQMSVGRNAVTDTAAYFSIGPRYGATKGFMPPIVGDTATFSSGKRNGLLIFSVQKNKFLYWDSVRVQWSDMAGGSGSYILAGDTSAMLAPYLRKADTTAMLLPYIRHAGYGLTKSGQSFLVDTLNIATRAWRQKGLDSLAALEVSGSGTTNYVPKFTASTTIGNSQIFDNGTSVGINTASPASRLHAFGTSGATTIIAEGATNNTAYGRLEMRGRPQSANQSTGYIVAASTEGGQAATNIGAIDFAMSGAGGNAHYMAFSTHNGTSLGERLRIFANGRVFVGASPTDAGYQLDINGTLRSVNGANFATTSGNVGIGTASPSAKLTVVGAGAQTILNSGSAADARMEFHYNSGREGFISWDTDNLRLQADAGNYLTFFSNATERLRITSGGNVGINTTSPTHLLTLSQASGATVIALNNTFNTANNRNWGLQSNYLAYGDFTINQSNALFGDPSAAGTSRLYIQPNGRVGINTTTDAGYQLDVNGSMRSVNGAQFATSSGGVGIGVINDGTSDKLRVQGSLRILKNVNNFISQQGGVVDFVDTTIFATTPTMRLAAVGSLANAAGFSFLTGTSTSGGITEKMVITGAGDVGINQASPSYKLDINGTLRSVNGANFATSSGNVGIGTASPLQLFTVKVNTSETVAIQDQAGFGGLVFKHITTSAFRDGTIDAANLYLQSQSGGEVRINTTTDAGDYKLQVVGNARIGTGKLDIASNTTFGIGVARSGTSEVAGQIYNSNGILYLGAESSAGGQIFSGSSAYAAVIGSGANYPLQFATNNITRATMTTSGNLLLGFTTDSYFLKLQVNGSIFSNNQVLAQGVNAQIAADSSTNVSPLYISNQSLTGSSAQGLFYGSTTWNTTGNPSLIDLAITNTASGATSNYIKISDGSNIFRVTKAAEVVTAAPTGGSIRKWKLGEAATVSPTSPNRTIRVEIDGTVYYLHAKTTND